MTKCSKCKQTKPDKDFYKHTETGLPMRYCKVCLKEYNRSRYDKDKVKAYNKKYWREVTSQLPKIKGHYA